MDRVGRLLERDPAQAAERLRAGWEQLAHGGTHLVVIESAYRTLGGPLLRFIDEVGNAHPQDTIMVVLPEYVPAHWWEHLLHNQTALRLKAALLFRPGVVVTNVPYHVSPA